MKDEWKHIGTRVDGQAILIDGVDVWKFDWHSTPLQAQVKDPAYGQEFAFHVYKITVEGKQIEFAAGEFSNCIWGFYTRKN